MGAGVATSPIYNEKPHAYITTSQSVLQPMPDFGSQRPLCHNQVLSPNLGELQKPLTNTKIPESGLLR